MPTHNKHMRGHVCTPMPFLIFIVAIVHCYHEALFSVTLPFLLHSVLGSHIPQHSPSPEPAAQCPHQHGRCSHRPYLHLVGPMLATILVFYKGLRLMIQIRSFAHTVPRLPCRLYQMVCPH